MLVRAVRVGRLGWQPSLLRGTPQPLVYRDNWCVAMDREGVVSGGRWGSHLVGVAAVTAGAARVPPGCRPVRPCPHSLTKHSCSSCACLVDLHRRGFQEISKYKGH